MHGYPSTTGSSIANTNLESVATVIDDLISDRSIWRKIICIVLCVVFVLSAWIMVVLHVVHFTNETVLEASVTVVTLVLGQYLGTGIVDGYQYWKRWSKGAKKSRTKQQEENKEAWVCMRITLVIMGLAPVSRYIESIFVVRRMISLEKRYLSDAVALAKEVKQPSSLPSGSLISGPTMVSRQWETGDPMRNAVRFRNLDAGLAHVYKVRRQFRRTEQDAALVALASGVLGAGPFVFSQGVLFFRRVGLNFSMATDTMVGILVTTILGIVWLCAGLTHYYPAAYDQAEFDFDRGLGQVPFGGLVLLYFAHLVHVTLRLGTFALFTGQFYWIVLAVLGFHFLIVLMTLIVARACTRVDYSNPAKLERANISANLLSDIMFAYVGIFEFTNAYAKYTRTRYFLFYFFYYLENSAMVGAWYVHFTYPQVWYYLPSLLVVVVAQFLGFILLQLYLYFFSRPRRKTTLCGLCFRHIDPEIDQPVPQALSFQGDESVRRADSLHATSVLGGPEMSVLSSRSGMPRRSSGGLYDPVFGQKIAQAAIPKTHRRRGTASNHTAHALSTAEHEMKTSTQGTAPSDTQPRRVYKQHGRRSDMSSKGKHRIEEERQFEHEEDAVEHETSLYRSSSHLLPISAEEAVERELHRYNRRTLEPPDETQNNLDPNRQSSGIRSEKRPRDAIGSTTRKTAQREETPRPGKPPTNNTATPGVFQPRPLTSRQRWPYSPNTRR